MALTTRLKSLLFGIGLFTVATLAAMVYHCTVDSCYYSRTPRNNVESTKVEYYFQNVGKEFHFDTAGDAIMVFLHIQKTGGTKFGKHLVQDLDIRNPCFCPRKKKRCDCKRPNADKMWLFSRYSVGWLCGLHADWTELQSCLPKLINKLEGKNRKRRFLYITILREPVARYLSEFRCYQRGTTWRTSLHMCNGRVPSKAELPPCYSGENWTDVTIEKFMSCPSNLANNRQTRSLADLKLVGCYNTSAMPLSERETILLKSAKKNLESMAYFALVEHQLESQYLFEKTFDMKFIRRFTQMNAEETRAGSVSIDPSSVERIQELVSLDIKLYAFAKELFFKRLKYFREKDGIEEAEAATISYV